MGIKIEIPDIEEIKKINREKRRNTIILICGLLMGLLVFYEGVFNNEPMLALLGGGVFGICLIPMIVKIYHIVYDGIFLIYCTIRKPKILKTRWKEMDSVEANNNGTK